MSSRYKTQCPRCHTIYPMPESKLGEEKARANCGKCHHTFFLNLHIVDPNVTTVDQINAEKTATATTPVAPAPVSQKVAPVAAAMPATQIIADDESEDIVLPRVPTRQKKVKAPPAEGMIFDGMDGDDEEVSFDSDGLDDFLNQDFDKIDNLPPVAQKVGEDVGEDEAWLDELLKNDDSPAIAVSSVTHRPKDDLSDIIGEDINSLIPEAPLQDSPEAILDKVNARITAHAPTQEQILTKRGIGSTLPWVFGSVLMLALLGVQYVLFNQHSIAKNPEQANLVRTLCPFCNIIAADPTAFSTSYELSPGAADFSTNMIATLKNTSSDDQIYPNLKIRVMSEAGLIGDLALSPEEYLPFSQTIITPNQADGRFMLTLDAPMEDIKTISIEPFY